MGSNEIEFGVREFILGGNAEFTIVQDATSDKGPVEERYKVKKSFSNPNIFFVYAKELEKGELVYHGYIVRKGDDFQMLKAKTLKFPERDYNKSAMAALNWVLRRGDKLPSVVHVLHHGKCSRCGKKLTDTESLRCGLGPECRKKMHL